MAPPPTAKRPVGSQPASIIVRVAVSADAKGVSDCDKNLAICLPPNPLRSKTTRQSNLKPHFFRRGPCSYLAPSSVSLALLACP